jgi:DTW domain-containing protein YfiP
MRCTYRKIASMVAKAERREYNRACCISRELCEGCNRPPVLCICESLPPKLISTSTHVLILQHRNEFRRKSLSTVPLMPLVLEKCTVKVGYNFQLDQLELVQECLAKGQKPLLLFPGPNSISLDANIGATQTFQEQEQLLILIDGTWAEARRMMLQSPTLVEKSQQVQFTADYESIYDVVRKEPEKHCISTLEACAHALTLLEPDKSKDRASEAKKYLEDSMRDMVDTKRRIHEIRNDTPEPRFTRPGTKIYERNKRRWEIKEKLFR